VSLVVWRLFTVDGVTVWRWSARRGRVGVEVSRGWEF
jgi:hypothetical protein